MAGKRSRKSRSRTVVSDIQNSNSAFGVPDDEVKDGGKGNAPAPKDHDAQYEALVSRVIQSAEDYVDTTLAQARLDAADYYSAQPFGDEEEGRTQVVLSEVRDTVLSMLPSLLRIFCGGDKVVVYDARRPDQVQAAEDATEAVNYIFYDLNKGFLILHDAFKDGLVKKVGVVTWWAEDEESVVTKSYSGMTEDEVLYFLQENPDAKFLEVEKDDPLPDGTETYEFTATIRDKERKYRAEAVPPEEFFIDPRAKSPEDAECVGTRSFLTVSQLVEMGFDEDEIREHGAPGQVETAEWATERAKRVKGYDWPERAVDAAMQRVRYFRAFIRVDKDGDGTAELRKIQCIGPNYHILSDEPVAQAPFAVFCPDPEPHTVYGWSIADVTMDLQRIKSHVMRDIMDSLKQSIFPRTGLVEGQVNIDDALNKEVGAIIRMKQPGMLQDLSTPFVGQQALPIMDLLDQIKAQRTGVTPASQGLDADLLQSTTKSAVTAQISAAQERIELIARIFAETGMTQLFKGLLRLITEHQDKPFFVKLRGKPVAIDPSGWDPNMNVSVNVGLGRGDDMQQMDFLSRIAEKQEQVLQTLGPVNPLVDFGQYRNTVAKIVQKAGFKNPDEFFKQVTPDALAQIEQAASQPPKPTPEELLARAELAKVLAEGYSRVEKSAQERVKLQLEADFERDKLDAEIILKTMDMSGKYGAPLDPAPIIQFLQRPRPEINALADVLIEREKSTGGAVLGQIGAVLGPDRPATPTGDMMDNAAQPETGQSGPPSPGSPAPAAPRQPTLSPGQKAPAGN